VAFLNLNIDQQELEKLGELRHIIYHCNGFASIKNDSVLTKFIE